MLKNLTGSPQEAAFLKKCVEMQGSLTTLNEIFLSNLNEDRGFLKTLDEMIGLLTALRERHRKLMEEALVYRKKQFFSLKAPFKTS